MTIFILLKAYQLKTMYFEPENKVGIEHFLKLNIACETTNHSGSKVACEQATICFNRSLSICQIENHWHCETNKLFYLLITDFQRFN